MKYNNHSMKINLAEKQGDLPTAVQLMLDEIRENCKKLSPNSIEYETFMGICKNYYYLVFFEEIPQALYEEVKSIRKDIRQIMKFL